jgi:carbonic anhydrase
MEVAMADCDLIAAYRIDNAELKRSLELAYHDNSTLADESIAYKKRAEKAEDDAKKNLKRAKRVKKENVELLAKNARLHESYLRATNMANDLTHLGNILLNQDGMIDECVKQVEEEWRALVKGWRNE